MIIFFIVYESEYISFYLNVDPNMKIRDMIINNEILTQHFPYPTFSINDRYYKFLKYNHLDDKEEACKEKFLYPINKVLLKRVYSPLKTEKGLYLKNDKTLSESGIKENDILKIYAESFLGAGFDNIKYEKDLNIGFDVNLAKRNELYINLIHFDSNMTNDENYKYYNDFKVDVVGYFYAIDNIGIFKDYLK